MKRKIRFIFPLLLLSTSLAGCTIISIKDKGSSEQTVSGYYKNYDLKKTGGRLIQELQKMCFEKHTKWIEYEQTKGYFTKTASHDSCDAIKEGSSVNQYFYSGKELAGYSGTREHVWPCANSGGLWDHQAATTSPHYVDNKYYIGGGSDMYHVRPTTDFINTARGNSRFSDLSQESDGVDEVKESGGKYSLLIYGASKTSSGGYQYASKCEPADEMKGDVARIILYVFVHYQERGDTPSGYVVAKNGQKFNYTDMTGPLALHSVMDGADDDACKAMLMAWNKLDPPSEVEKLRNQTVQKIQGNRNPFVDYPELVDQMFE